MPIPVFVNAIASFTDPTGASSRETATWPIEGRNRYLVGGIACGSGTDFDNLAMRWGGSAGEALVQNGAQVEMSSLSIFNNMTLWTLKSPRAGSLPLWGQWSGTPSATGIVGVALANVDQGNPIGPLATTTIAGASSIALDVVSEAGDLVVAFAWGIDYGGAQSTLTDDAGQTRRGGGVPSVFHVYAISTKVAVGQLTTLTWTTGVVQEHMGAMGFAVRGLGGASGVSDEIMRRVMGGSI